MKKLCMGLMAIALIGLLLLSGCKTGNIGKTACINSGGVWQKGWISPAGTQESSCVCTGSGKVKVGNKCVPFSQTEFICCKEGQNYIPLSKERCVDEQTAGGWTLTREIVDNSLC